MKVKALKEILNQFNDNAEVVASGSFMGFKFVAAINLVSGVKTDEREDIIKALTVEYPKATTCVLALGNRPQDRRWG